jgi:predicted XRE-type DNA-binding protein
MAIKIHHGSGNVFTDLGFDSALAENLRVRADLMITIEKEIVARGLTQTKAASLFGVSQPRVSDLTRGKIDRFSIDTLVAMLGHAGISVHFTTQRKRHIA